MNESIWQRLTRGVRRIRQRPDWPRFVGSDWEDWIMTTAVTDRFHAKQGRSTGRWMVQAAENRLTVYLKRHYRLPWWRGVLAALWPNAGWSPALQEWRHLEWACARGLPVPAAVAAAEFIGPWGRFQSFLAVEELPGMIPLHEAIPAAARRFEPATFRSWKRALVAEVSRLTRELHQQRCFHKDLYLCHFYIPQGDVDTFPQWQGRVHLIDLHRLGRHSWSRRIWQVKDLAQLLYSSEIEGLDARDRFRFWFCYLGSDRRTLMGRWLKHWVLAKWRRYQRHNQKRKLS
jgi:hypothetical protein